MAKRDKKSPKPENGLFRQGIPPILHEEIVQMYMRGNTYQQIATWYNNLDRPELQLNNKITRAAIGKLLRKLLSERAESTKAIVVAAASKSAVNDIAIMEDLINDLYMDYKEARISDYKAALIIQRELRGWVTTKMEVIGATVPMNQLKSAAQEDVVNQLQLLLEEQKKELKSKDPNIIDVTQEGMNE